ncbi:hypothetical protein [Candidatus Pelagibacter sp. HIMB1782]|uniref:hypothetical protein n=1 Tax=Candidatus Pelagibacter sp. HIMB1782 TaxID=3413375 RepID=UPI003F84B0A1
MNEAIDFETYLVISNDKFEIYLLDIKNFENLYKKEFKYQTDLEKIDLNLLDEFLEKHIFSIEKVAGSFVNKINLIVQNKTILNLDLSIKKKNYSQNISDVFLKNILTDVKDLFKESYREYKLIHMLINKYIVNEKSYTSLKDETNSDEICLEIKLISISNSIVFEIENILKKYQIQVINYFDKEYLKDFFKDEQLEISHMANKILNGINNNEVLLTSKNTKKLGFFEKFFQLFS